MAKITKKLSKIRQNIAQKRRDYLKARPHRSFKKTKRVPRPIMDGIRRNVKDSFAIIWQERRILFGLALVYMVVSYLFVGGVAQADFVELKNATLEVFGGSINSISTVVSVLTSTMSGAFNSQTTELQQFLAVIFGVLFWLSVIWALRMRFADQKIGMRDALYSSAAPLVAYVIVGLFIIAQLTPGAFGVIVYNVAQSGGYLVGGVEVMLFVIAAFLLCVLSIYWLSSSFLALVIVTLPQMRPWRAMQIAGEMTIGRRRRMLAHLGAMVLVIFASWVCVLLPVLLVDSWLRFDWLPLVPIAVAALSAFTLLYAATYIYKLYRSML